MELVLLGGQEALLLLASACPKGHCPAKPSAPCRSEGPHEKAGLEPRAAQLGTPARLLPRLCSLCLYSCCQVRKHCEWCRALICRHEKPSALLKGRTACCHSETGKGLLSEGAFSPLGDTIGWRKTTTFSRSGQRFLEDEAGRKGRGYLSYQVRFSLF